jgi:hypothetical protein
MPEAWDTIPVPEEEISFLSDYFVSYPTAQNNVTFPVSPTVPTLPIATGDTRAASAQFVQSAKNTQTWGALQTFNAGMVTSAIDPTTAGGTLLIGNGSTTNNIEIASVASRATMLHLGDGNNSIGGIHIGNGANSSNNVQILNGAGSTGTINLGTSTATINLNCPLTPQYTYSAGGSGVGRIGEVITGTNVSLVMVANTPKTISSMTLPAGIWLLTANVGGVANSTFFTVAFSTTTNSLITGLVAINTTSIQGVTPNQNLVFPFVNTVSTTMFCVASIGSSATFTSCIFTATRLA